VKKDIRWDFRKESTLSIRNTVVANVGRTYETRLGSLHAHLEKEEKGIFEKGGVGGEKKHALKSDNKEAPCVFRKKYQV